MKRTTSKKTATKSTDKSRVFSSATKSSSKKGQHPSQYHPASPSSGAGRPMTSSKSTKQSLVSQSRSGKKNSIHDHDSNSKRKYLQNFGGESNATSSLLSMKSAASNHKKKRKTSIPSDANALFSQNQGGSGITDPTNARIGLLPLELDSSNSMPATVSSDGTCCCLGCSLPRCGKCTLCEQSGFLYNTCVFKTCHVNRDNDEEIRNFNEIKSILEERDFLEVGSRVYAAWNKDDPKSGWYWGAITKQYFMKRNFSNAMNEYYSITFDDGDKKCNVDREVRL